MLGVAVDVGAKAWKPAVRVHTASVAFSQHPLSTRRETVDGQNLAQVGETPVGCSGQPALPAPSPDLILEAVLEVPRDPLRMDKILHRRNVAEARRGAPSNGQNLAQGEGSRCQQVQH